jgi:hypothetical protein
MRLVLALLLSLPQVLTNPLPIPPDLLHVSKIGCHINNRHSDPPIYTVNAKSGEQEEEVRWEVIPFADYDPLPDKTKRDQWTPEKDKPIFEIVGSLDFIPREVSDACSAWMKMVNKARVDEAHKAGKSAK